MLEVHEYIALEFTMVQLENMRSAGYDLYIKNGTLYVDSHLLVELALGNLFTKSS